VPGLVFDCLGATADRFAATPGFTLRLRIADVDGGRVDGIALRCQIRVEPHRRRYDDPEADRLRDLFGDRDRWADTLKPLQVATVPTMVPGFTASTTHDLPVPCGYDLEVASTKYFDALSDGEIPLLLLYSGTVFRTGDGRFSVQQVPWSTETSFGLPVAVYRQTIDTHYPNRAWVPVQRETLETLRRFKSDHALPTWDSTIAALLDKAGSVPAEERGPH
jgi:uncharacterized protein DUF6084